MKIQINKILSGFLLSCLLSIMSMAHAQDDSQNIFSEQEQAHYIYFGDSIGMEILNDMELTNLSIIVKNDNDELVAQLNESTLKEFVFSTPGNYKIELSSDHVLEKSDKECNHLVHNRIISLLVLPYHLQFDFNKMNFSTELIGGKDMTSALLSIPVEVKIYSGASVNLEKLKFLTAGVNTTLEGITKSDDLILNPGVNLISYQMKGQVSNNTFIMFDFLDNYGLVHSFGYPTKIK